MFSIFLSTYGFVVITSVFCLDRKHNYFIYSFNVCILSDFLISLFSYMDTVLLDETYTTDSSKFSVSDLVTSGGYCMHCTG